MLLLLIGLLLLTPILLAGGYFIYCIIVVIALIWLGVDKIKGKAEENERLARLPEAERNAEIEKKKERLHHRMRVTAITVAITFVIMTIISASMALPGDSLWSAWPLTVFFCLLSGIIAFIES